VWDEYRSYRSHHTELECLSKTVQMLWSSGGWKIKIEPQLEAVHRCQKECYGNNDYEPPLFWAPSPVFPSPSSSSYSTSSFSPPSPTSVSYKIHLQYGSQVLAKRGSGIDKENGDKSRKKRRMNSSFELVMCMLER